MPLNIVYESAKKQKLLEINKWHLLQNHPNPEGWTAFLYFFVFWVFLNPKFPSTRLKDLLKSLSKSFSDWNIFEE